MASLTIIGLHEDPVLSAQARQALRRADIVFGAPRLYPMVAQRVEKGRWRPWRSPIERSIDEIRDRRDAVVVLASGNPMFYGIGATLCRRFPRRRITVLPAPSSFDLACARLGWPQQDVVCCSLHGKDPALLHRWLAPGRRIVALTTDGTTVRRIADWLVACGYGASRIDLLENLAGDQERHRHAVARRWPDTPKVGGLNVVGLSCVPLAGAPILAPTPGLDDACFVHDGQLTKRDVRAATLARLRPIHSQTLWDIGAGCGSIAIEWMRADPANRAIAIESNRRRAAMIRANARALGVPNLRIIEGRAPDALAGLEPPDAVFIGGSVADRRIWSAARRALAKGGRIVANALSREGQTLLFEQHRRHGGDIALIQGAVLSPIGGTVGWQPQHPLMRYSQIKE